MATDDQTGDSRLEQALLDIAVESWRFSKVFSRVVSKLDVGDAHRFTNQQRYFLKRLEDSLETTGLKLVNVEALNSRNYHAAVGGAFFGSANST